MDTMTVTGILSVIVNYAVIFAAVYGALHASLKLDLTRKQGIAVGFLALFTSFGLCFLVVHNPTLSSWSQPLLSRDGAVGVVLRGFAYFTFILGAGLLQFHR